MSAFSTIQLFRSYYQERPTGSVGPGGNSPRYSYGKRKTNLAASYSIEQQEAYPLFGRKSVKLESEEISLSQVDFRNAKTVLWASRSIATGVTTAVIRSGSRPDTLYSGQQIQFWYGTDIRTGAGDDSIMIDNTSALAGDYLGKAMFLAGQLDMGEGSDDINIRVYNKNTLSTSNDPGLAIVDGLYSASSSLAMGDGEDTIEIDCPYSYALTVSSNGFLHMGAGNDAIDIVAGGMAMYGTVSMGAGDDKFVLRHGRAFVRSSAYMPDPIIDGGRGGDLMVLGDSSYTIVNSDGKYRITNGIAGDSDGGVDITLSSFEFISGLIVGNAVALAAGRLDVVGGIATYQA